MIKAWEAKSGKQNGTMSSFSQPVLDVTCSLDDDYVAGCSTDGNKINLFRTKTFNKITTYQGHSDTINAIRFNYNKKQVISGSMDRTIR